jgi:hypothetical protein
LCCGVFDSDFVEKQRVLAAVGCTVENDDSSDALGLQRVDGGRPEAG